MLGISVCGLGARLELSEPDIVKFPQLAWQENALALTYTSGARGLAGRLANHLVNG